MAVGLETASSPFIVPIGGGKGGVGKTFLTANLAIALAELNQKTIVVDLDLGGSNLYSWLGTRNIHPGIGDFLTSKKKNLREFLIQDSRDHLSFIPGDGQTTGLANIKHIQKLKIARSIRSLQADFILLDLSAGTTFNTLDFFNLSTNGIVIAIPEMTSVMNALGFLKNFLLRAISREFSGNKNVLDILNSFRKRSIGRESVRFSEIIKEIEDFDSEMGNRARNICGRYVPRIVFNLSEDLKDLAFGERLREIVKEYLLMDLEFIGFIYRDGNVPKSLNKGTPFLDRFPDSSTSDSIRKIANRLVKFGRSRIDGSFERLCASLPQG